MNHPKTGRSAAAFLALFLLFALTTLLWLRLNKAPPNWDDAWYLSNSLTLYDAWTDGGLVGFASRFLAALGFKAPLITALPLPFYFVFGRRWHAAYLVNVVAMAILFGAVWAIGKRLRNARTGLIAVHIAGTMPLMYGLSRWYLVEYPLAAFAAVAFWLVLLASTAEGLLTTYALGLVCGVGLLLKADFPLFLAPAMVWLLLRRRDPMRTLLAIAVPAILLAAPWYILHWRATLQNALSAGFGPSAVIQGTGAIFSLSAILKYLAMVANRGLSWYYLALAAAAAVMVVRRRNFAVFRPMAWLVLWVAPFLVFVFGGNKDVRYIAPVLPAFAIAAACLLDGAAANRRWIGIAALVFPVVSLSAISFGWPYAAADNGYAFRYDPYSWRQDEILTLVADGALFPHVGRKTLLIGTDRALFNADNFQLSAVQDRLPLRVETTAYGERLDQLIAQAGAAEYFVYKEGGEPESPFFNRRALELRRCLQRSPEWIEIPFGRLLPDGGTAHVLRRTAAIANGYQPPARCDNVGHP